MYGSFKEIRTVEVNLPRGGKTQLSIEDAVTDDAARVLAYCYARHGNLDLYANKLSEHSPEVLERTKLLGKTRVLNAKEATAPRPPVNTAA